MHSLITILQVALVWLFAFALGYPIVKALLPEDIESETGLLVAPVTGYLVLCFAAFTLSAAFKLPTGLAVWIVMAVMAAAFVGMQLRPRWRIRTSTALPQLRLALVLVVPMVAITLLPFFVVGADTYLGAVNPDYSAGIVDNYYLLAGNLPTTSFGVHGADTFHPIDNLSGFITPAARFGADLFGIAIQHLLGVDIRTSLTLAIAFFIINIPLTLYFMCRTTLHFTKRASLWSAWLIGLSGPIGMSTVYFYIGQNSGLPALPLLCALVYLMLTRPGWRTLLLCALLSNALFINYFAMLPYAIAPGGLLGLYLAATGRLPWKRAFLLAGSFLAVALLLKVGTIGYTLASMKAWGVLLAATLQGQFFMEFLTEGYFPYFLGIYNYPANAYYTEWFGIDGMRLVGVTLAFALMVLYAWGVVRWWKETREVAARVFVLAAIVVYAAVWARYTFFMQYGYAIFKMSSWLQFILVPFFAYALDWVVRKKPWRVTGAIGRRAGYAAGAGIVVVGCVAYVAANVVTSAIYARDGFGRNRESGYVVNQFGMAGNRDYHELEEALKKYVKPEQSVGLVFTDWMRNFWTSYYTRNIRQSWMAHEIMPGDDENLPDVETGVLVDYYGNIRQEGNPYNHGAVDDFYLTNGAEDLNSEIADFGFVGPPVWQNKSFRLYPKSAARDVLYLAHGFYRVEYRKQRDYFRPNPMRWSADGGQFYLLHPSQPGKPYRLGFDVIVGYEYPKDSRTLEIWIDGEKSHEVVVNSSGRVQTEPFYPETELTKIVVVVKERNRASPRRMGLWNRDLPMDYRRLNVAFGNVRVILPDSPPPKPPPRDRDLPFLEWQNYLGAFNGVDTVGWMDRVATLSFTVPEGATRAVLSVLAPGDVPGKPSLKYPFEIKYSVNGREKRKTLPWGDWHALELSFLPGERTATIRIESPQSIDPEETALREKTVRRSLLLQNLRVQ